MFTEAVVGQYVKEKCGSGSIVDNGSIDVRASGQNKYLVWISKTGMNIVIETGKVFW